MPFAEKLAVLQEPSPEVLIIGEVKIGDVNNGDLFWHIRFISRRIPLMVICCCNSLKTKINIHPNPLLIYELCKTSLNRYAKG